jgi:hypothetical protein
MDRGLSRADVVDLVAKDAAGNEYTLVIVASSPWDDDAVLSLQAKVKNYITFVESGQLLRVYPDAVGKRIAFRLSTMHPLSPMADRFVHLATSQWLRPLSIAFEVRELNDG